MAKHARNYKPRRTNTRKRSVHRVANYGFRLHTVTLHAGRTAARLQLTDLRPAGIEGNFRQHLMSRLKSIEGRLFVGAAKYAKGVDSKHADVADNGKLQPYLEVISARNLESHIEVLLDYGHENDFEALSSRSRDPKINLKGRAPVRRYRVLLWIPQHGDQIVMASSTIGRSFAGEALFNRLRVFNHDEALFEDEHGDLARELWLRYKPHTLFDPKRLEDVSAEAYKPAITLRRKGYDASGQRNPGDLVLSQSGLPLNKLDDIKQTMWGWWQNRKSGTKESRSEAAVSELGAIMGENIDDFRFTDGEIAFTEHGKNQRISPNTVDRLFVYPLGDERPSPDEFLEAVYIPLRRSLPSAGVDLEL